MYHYFALFTHAYNVSAISCWIIIIISKLIVIYLSTEYVIKISNCFVLISNDTNNKALYLLYL